MSQRQLLNNNKMAIFNFNKNKKPDGAITPILPSDIYDMGVLELKDIIAPSALRITPNNIYLGDKVARTFFVISYPRFLSEEWFSPIINMDKIFDISIFIHPIDSGTALKDLQKKLAEVQSQISTKEERGFVRDPILDTAYRDIETLRDQLQQARERIFNVGLYITIYGQDEEELNNTEREVKSSLEAILVYVKPALFQQEEGFKSMSPLI